ncbi:hypothetical protein LOTGIDRAFT_237231 [Lottia gigantea]|uniref:Cytochrome b561 domain-containing protein n=1 Tax=Lottia gigantea TaxID=225164 RepID=V3ZD45_LOTGI|nr:hypothetical protein LOTGIDRAFT_237231 [Lottia gigantea]ESO81942.1 hypothetical protein LOTGIDRAFT_237231 [Lottia gigantea]
MASSFKDGVMECKIAREKTGQGDKDVYDLTKDWKVMVTYGAAAPGYRKNPHDDSLTWITENTVDFQKAVDVANVPVTYPLVKAHACLMVIAWLATAASGLLTARYMKPYWATNTIQGMKVWFWLHRTSMVLTLVLTSVGFGLIFIQIKDYSEISGPFYQKAHPILGIIVTILVYINAIMSKFRKPPGTPYRPLFNFGHFFVGTGSYILAILTIFSGVELKKLKLPIESYTILIIYCVLIFCGYSMIEMIPKLPEKKAKDENIEMDDPTTNEPEEVKKPKTRDHQKKLVLVIHLLAAWAITIALLYFIIIN